LCFSFFIFSTNLFLKIEVQWQLFLLGGYASSWLLPRLGCKIVRLWHCINLSPLYMYLLLSSSRKKQSIRKGNWYQYWYVLWKWSGYTYICLYLFKIQIVKYQSLFHIQSLTNVISIYNINISNYWIKIFYMINMSINQDKHDT